MSSAPIDADLPFSQSCENNKDYIFDALKEVFSDRVKVLEIGSATGQHACYFAERMPWLRWQPTDMPENLLLLEPRCAAYSGQNLLPPSALDVRQEPWPIAIPDAVFTANTLHIMSFASVQKFFAALGRSAPQESCLAIYGPFNYNGQYTSESNARFDQWLAQQNPESAIRHFENISELAGAAGFTLQADKTMPANNRLLIWSKTEQPVQA